MNVHEIKRYIDNDIPVYWSHTGYVVIKDKINQYLIHCLHNDHFIGLTHKDGITLNGEESDFFIDEDEALLILANKDAKKVMNKMVKRKYNCKDLY